MPDINTHNQNPSLRRDIHSAAETAYIQIAERKGLGSEEVHRLPVCYQAASIMVNELLANGHPVVQEIRAGLSVLEHSFVVLPTGKGEDRDIVIDPTWQRFLPRGKVTDKLPRVLVGTRSSVANQAMASGVDELTARIWQDGGKMTTEQQRQADRQAEAAAEQADADGAWERFAQGR